MMSICSHKTIEGLFYAFIETTLEQEQIDDLYREPCISPQIQLIKLQKVILVTSKENYFLNRKECLRG